MEKAFEKRRKIIEDHGGKNDALKTLELKDREKQQIEAIEDKSDDHDDKLSMQKIIFDEFSTKKMDEIYSMSKQIDFNDLIYYFESKSLQLLF